MPPDPADAALRDAADALARRVRERLPAAQAHGRAEIAALPPPLARVLLARLDARVDREARPPASDWLDADRARDAARAWRDAARQAARVPAPAWAAYLSDGCLLALSLVVRPAETLAAVAFEDDGPDERPAMLLVARVAAVAASPFLPEIAGRYVERKGLARLDRAALESLLRRIDRRMAESFSADEWADAVTPLSVLAGPDGVPYALTVALFEAKGQPEMARAFAGRGRQSADEIRALLATLVPDIAPSDPTAEAVGPQHAVALPGTDVPPDAPDVPADAPDAPDVPDDALDVPPDVPAPDVLAPDVPATTIDVPPDTPAPDVSPPAASSPPPDDPDERRSTAPDRDFDAWIGPTLPDTDPGVPVLPPAAGPPSAAAPLPEPTAPPPEPAVPDDTPLWQRYAPAAAAPDAAPALWKRFMPRPAGPPDAHLPSPPVAPPRPPLPPAPPPGDARPPDLRPATPEDALSGLDRLERAALGQPADAARRALFITGLFGGSEADYGRTLVALARDASWTEASDTIARDIFRRHRVSPLSDAAVAFVDDVESRFRPL